MNHSRYRETPYGAEDATMINNLWLPSALHVLEALLQNTKGDVAEHWHRRTFCHVSNLRIRIRTSIMGSTRGRSSQTTGTDHKKRWNGRGMEDSLVRQVIALVDDPAAAWELLASQPDDARLKFFRGLLKLKQYHYDSQRNANAKFKTENGVSRTWAHALSHPEYHERKKERNREYVRRKRLENKNTLADQSGIGVLSTR
jgi:hypothetical protein